MCIHAAASGCFLTLFFPILLKYGVVYNCETFQQHSHTQYYYIIILTVTVYQNGKVNFTWETQDTKVKIMTFSIIYNHGYSSTIIFWYFIDLYIHKTGCKFMGMNGW